MRIRKAQSILEYVIVLTAIIVAVIALAQGPITRAVNTMFNDSADLIEQKSADFLSAAGQNSAVGGR